MTSPNDSPMNAPAYPNWLRVILLIVVIGKAVTSVTALSILFDDDPSIPGQTFGGMTISATIALSAMLAVVAFVCALRGRLAGAIASIAGLALLDWLSYVPLAVIHWSEFPGPGYAGFMAIVQMVVLPLLAASAIALAWRGERLGLATVLALTPTVVFALGVVAFGIGVALYGF